MLSMMLNEVPPLPPAPDTAPKFPIYLLPSLTRPFRRRRQSSLSDASRSPHADELPSLSASPTESIASHSPAVESPTTPSFLHARFSFGSRRRSSSLSTTTSPTSPIDPPDVATIIAPKLARTQPDTIRCSSCGADFAFGSQIVSKGFTGRYGRAYLVSGPQDQPPSRADLVNIKVGRPETRLLVTGSHVVADINCVICNAKVGWKYVDAKEESQKYKVGKFILETQRCVDYRSWEDVVTTLDGVPEIEESQQLRNVAFAKAATGTGSAGGRRSEEPVIFDSDDEDECEDLFSGTWDPEVVAKRRSRKVNRRQRPNMA